MVAKTKITTQWDYKDDRFSVKNVGAFGGSDAFLLRTGDKAVLIDSGFSFCADILVENIKTELKGQPLDYILLTHSHYDHASGAPYCKAAFAGAQIVASAYTAKIFTKPSAKAVMKEMNDSAALDYGYGEYPDRLGELGVDIVVAEGDVIDLGNMTLKVLEAPGHTKCSIAFYSPEEKLLISNETMGVMNGKDMIAPAYLVGYDISVNFIKRVLAMDVALILVPHLGILKGEDCKNFLKNALRDNEGLKDLILSDHAQGKTTEEIIAHYQAEYYNDYSKRIQPLQAFTLNASYLVPMIIKEQAGSGDA